ncbi:LysE family translocator [Marinobacterium mangrovicola]|uniref:Threonine/homoserine/homoserine lactone efflux protein n=1 Tax=Marinobacterium mangrovicola TaxID=1476959 RepID=A0A4V2PGD6_9GAMM|nr:LysE family translocator [Marinobacterium mangrovicola]TCK16446.1 threonine/homoserine/homoserine lactone efflux protein [Marinobacterium mangrovicola]
MSALVVSFSLFAFIASATPGPTNLLALSNGSRFGTRSTLPFAFGASLGAAAVLLLTATGLGQLIQEYPLLRLSLALCGVLWLTSLAWKLYHAPAVQTDDGTECARACWYHGALMQPVNPKTWMMALTATSLFAPVAPSGTAVPSFIHAILMATIFFIVTLPCIAAWAWLGDACVRLLKSVQRLQLLNRVLAVLLAVSVWSALLL